MKKAQSMQRRIWLMMAACIMFGMIGAGVLIYADWFGFEELAASAAHAPTLAAEEQQRVYRIDPARSVVRYTVEEIFAGQGGNTAVGTTNVVAGDILIDPTHYANSQVGTIVINIEQFTSDSGLRDRRIRREFLESSTYPEAVFVPQALTDFPATIAEGAAITFGITGGLTIKETTAAAAWTVTATLEGDLLTGSATTTIRMSEYAVGPINIAGLVETADEVRLEFEFTAVRVTEDGFGQSTAATSTPP
jgi:polyisoprenoid-binding protein YceI